LEEVERLLNAHEKYQDIITAWVPRDANQDESKWGPAIAAHLAKLQVSDPIFGRAKIPVVVDLLDLEVEYKFVERIDETIDRTMKRLSQVKVAKTLLPRLNKPASGKLINLEANLASESEQISKVPDSVANLAKRTEDQDA
jgi:hypothetical protein